MEDAETAEAVVPQPGSGGDRLFGELLLGAMAGSALAPFVQAIATKLGEDVYGKVRDLLARRSREPAEHMPGESLTLADPQRAIVIQLPASLTTTEAAGLAQVRLPERTEAGWVYVRYDPPTGRWQATLVPQPPTGAIEVLPRDGGATAP
ncbi:hypothetical protein [Streptomyces palmae]|uniref:Uncharacterized protein n=1 Tax=Streptomyces palmae TaxID=1701085 RepID=A0A4Z0HA00_9ACTN|nr:hypothetical protein [Streptomyces palmae]TGB07411.1 hypothetical protein E4099_17070 [Streptomyces palmae]